MAKRITFHAGATSSAGPEALYALLADGATWPTWSPIGSFTLEREAPGGGEAVGAIRVFKTGTARSHEELVVMEPGKQLSYEAIAGMPFRNHRADIELTPTANGTTITWREAFDPKYPGTGWLVKAFLHSFVKRCVNGLARHADAQHRIAPAPGPSTAESA